MTPRQMLVKQLIDQPLHVLWGALSQLPLLVIVHLYGEIHWLPATIASSFGAFLMSQPRELVDQWPIVRKWDYVLDSVMFAVGGGLAGFVIFYLF